SAMNRRSSLWRNGHGSFVEWPHGTSYVLRSWRTSHEAIPAIPEQRGELRRACRARQGRADLQALQADGGRLAGDGEGAGLARRRDAAAQEGGVIYPPSLRAKRSNPACFAQSWIASSLALLAMTEEQLCPAATPARLISPACRPPNPS